MNPACGLAQLGLFAGPIRWAYLLVWHLLEYEG